jgi:hypothetical protein
LPVRSARCSALLAAPLTMLGSACRTADNTPLGSLPMLAWIAA